MTGDTDVPDQAVFLCLDKSPQGPVCRLDLSDLLPGPQVMYLPEIKMVGMQKVQALM